MPKTLVIVESPAKAKTIEGFLGRGEFRVLASRGHIRDLPSSAKQVPKGITDPEIRANRLGFLATLRELAAGVIDWREVS